MAANQPVSNYWIRAIPNGPIGNTTDNGRNVAILRYAGAKAIEPNTTSTADNILNEQDLVPLSNASAPGLPFPGGVDISYQLNITFNNGFFAINNFSFPPVYVSAMNLRSISLG